MVIDTSVILAIYFEEPTAGWAVDQLFRAEQLFMSTINLTEALIRFRDRVPADAHELEQRLIHSSIQFVAPDAAQASIAARARLTFPLNLGDCFAYALAKVEGHAIITLDADFRCVDVPVITPGY